ncbi:hypothetical protein BG011_004736 [Mortierella polycephala]|uniref:Major facilitator superfamily (MFS) profile domain-containing protein n=1 Tax=Mortierella polycephala TaxID=41804 RepID=A0A9P6U2A2_9FUNG|nr:hypothetical protein BG011_004736 [Mortierella polycephala]
MPPYMVQCSLVVSLTSLSIGYVIGSPNIPESSIRGINDDCGANPFTIQHGFPNCFQFSDLLWGFAVGCFCLGACAGGLIGGTLQNRIGRVRSLLLSSLFFVFGSLVLGLTYHPIQFIIGRIFLGLACGLGGVAAPTYLGEISTVHARGTLGTFHQLFLVIGLLLSNLVGLAWSAPPGWRFVLAVNGLPALAQCFLLRSIVESPRYLVSKMQLNEAQVVLQKLRGAEADVDIEQEFQEIVQLLLGAQLPVQEKDTEESLPTVASAMSVQRVDSLGTISTGSTVIHSSAYTTLTTTTTTVPTLGGHHGEVEKFARQGTTGTRQEPYGIIELFQSECRGLAIIGVLVHFLQQASGINGLVYYSTSFLSSVFGSGLSKYITVGVSVCNFMGTIVGVYLIDRVNRKTLMVASFVGISLSATLLVIGAYYDLGPLVAAAVFLYFATFAFGLGPIPWLLPAEMLPTYALSSTSSVATGVNWIMNFVIGLTFPSLTKALGNATFILFGAFTALGAVYIWYFVPETKSRSIEQIMAEMGVPARSGNKL